MSEEEKQELDSGRKVAGHISRGVTFPGESQSLCLLFLSLHKYFNIYLFLATSIYLQRINEYERVQKKGLQLFKWLL